MQSTATKEFWACYGALPSKVQKQAQASYDLWKANPQHGSLQFKPIRGTEIPVYSVRVSKSYRALAVRHGGEVIWFWIGSHADYDRLITKI